MATLTRDVERPAFLDRPTEGQLTFGGGAVRGRGAERGTDPAGHLPLSERLQAERLAAVGIGGGMSPAAIVTRGGEATLDELFVGAWEGLSARRPVTCPVCSETMLPRVGALGGACGACGSQVR